MASTGLATAFARFLVREGELPTWNPLINHRPPEETRAARLAYSLKELRAAYRRLLEASALPERAPGSCHPRTADVFLLRASTGLHQTEVDQLHRCTVYEGPLPDKGAGIRKLEGKHEIAGVLQVSHKAGHWHRVSVNAEALAAAMRLRRSVPSRTALYHSFAPIVPSNLRHTFVTLSGEVGKPVKYKSKGASRAEIAQIVGHRAGSTMTADRYDKLQVPPMMRLPLNF